MIFEAKYICLLLYQVIKIITADNYFCENGSGNNFMWMSLFITIKKCLNLAISM